MCTINLKTASIREIVEELNSRGLITNSKSNSIIINGLDGNSDLMFILTKGIPKEPMECRECKEVKDASVFSYYQSRVDQNGFLWRSNALCSECSTNSNKERKVVLDRANIPEMPKRGSECPNCKRKWRGNWHRHHVGEDFVDWWCGHCNTHLSDQRNKLV